MSMKDKETDLADSFHDPCRRSPRNLRTAIRSARPPSCERTSKLEIAASELLIVMVLGSGKSVIIVVAVGVKDEEILTLYSLVALAFGDEL